MPLLFATGTIFSFGYEMNSIQKNGNPHLNPLLRFHSLVIDVTMALDTLSLPVLEPLTPGRLLDMTVLALSCLYAGRTELP